MRIGFIEDTHLRGGTQIWVTEANRFFINQGAETVILAPTGSFVARLCKLVTWLFAQCIRPGILFTVRYLRATASKNISLTPFSFPRPELSCQNTNGNSTSLTNQSVPQ